MVWSPRAEDPDSRTLEGEGGRGTSLGGCTAKDTIVVQVKNAPVVSLSTRDTATCVSVPVQLQASGGTAYVWQPAATLSNPNIYNPVATPLANTVYYVTVSNTENCQATDSVKVRIEQHAVLQSKEPIFCFFVFKKQGWGGVWWVDSCQPGPKILRTE